MKKQIISTILCFCVVTLVILPMSIMTVTGDNGTVGSSLPVESSESSPPMSNTGSEPDPSTELDDSDYEELVIAWKVTVEESENGSVESSRETAPAGVVVFLATEPDRDCELLSLAVTDSNGNDIELRKRANRPGEYSFQMPEADVTVSAVFGAAIDNPFADVKESDFFHEAVLWAFENGITTGTAADSFSPGAPCTRAHAVTFLWRSLGCPEPAISECPFTDVEESDYFYKAVLWAFENGVTKGMTETSFGPDLACTRAHIVTFLWRAVRFPAPTIYEHPFTDVEADDYFLDPVLWALNNEITTGVTDTSFAPDRECTRAQMVTFLYRTFASK